MVNVRFELSLVPLTPNPKYKVIYADPPWEYRQSGSKKNSRGMAKQHYRTMSTDEICGLPIQSLAAEDALLFYGYLPQHFGSTKSDGGVGFSVQNGLLCLGEKESQGRN